MKVATDTNCFYGLYTMEEVIDILAEAGFDAIDYSNMDACFYNGEISECECKKLFTEIRKYAENTGIEFNQAHAPCPSTSSDFEENEVRFGYIVKSMRNSSYLGIDKIIVHGAELDEWEERCEEQLFEENLKFYNRLKPYCEEFGIKVALENLPHIRRHMFGEKVVNGVCAIPESFVRYVDALDSRWFTACLDIGHAMITGHNPEEFIRTLGGERLTALHIHDNNGLRDMHTLPYLGGMADWDAITKALADIDYKGDFNFEAGNFLKPLPKELYPHGAKMMAETGKYLVNKIKECN